MKCISIVLCLFAGFIAPSNGVPELVLPDAKITVKVVNEAGIPVTDAEAGVGFNQGGNTWTGEHKSESIRGSSDTNGLFSAQARCMGGIGISVQKEGFYRSSVRQDYPGTYQNKKRWEPWNPTIIVVLKEIKNPTPMYVKEVRTNFPIEDKAVGFDLEKGDWVSPYGRGAKSDFLFTFSRDFRSSEDYGATLEVKFENQKDGIQEISADPVSWVSLRLPHDAPNSGYSTNKVWEMGCTSKTGSFGFENPDGDVNHFFRVRTILNEKGRIEKTYYGKIYGPIRVIGIGRENAQIIFQYYFNPIPNDRNIEFNPDKNLFGGRDRFAP